MMWTPIRVQKVTIRWQYVTIRWQYTPVRLQSVQKNNARLGACVLKTLMTQIHPVAEYIHLRAKYTHLRATHIRPGA